MTPTDKVFLLPATVEQYREQLSEFLKQEQFGDAIALLRFLQHCEMQDKELQAEWEQLRVVLETEFPELVEEPELDEREMLRLYALQRAESDETYVDQLIDQFLEGDDMRVHALEQLILIEYPNLGQLLVEWLHNVEREPFIQWMALQELKRQGYDEPIRMIKDGHAVTVDPRAIPDEETAYPEPWAIVGGLAMNVAEQQDTSVMELLPSFWISFFILQFGTVNYQEWLARMEAQPNLWAFMVYVRISEILQGEFDVEQLAEWFEMQDVTQEQLLETIEFMKTLK